MWLVVSVDVEDFPGFRSHKFPGILQLMHVFPVRGVGVHVPRGNGNSQDFWGIQNSRNSQPDSYTTCNQVYGQWISWAAIEAEEGVYDWTDSIRYIEMAESKGAKVWFRMLTGVDRQSMATESITFHSVSPIYI